MSKEIVAVEEVLGSKVKIKFERQKMCGCCSLHYLCGGSKGKVMIDRQGLSLTPGDRVEVAVNSRQSLLAAVVVFFIPAALFLTGVLTLRRHGELLSFFLALGLVCLYYIAVKIALRRWGREFNLRILRKIT